MSTFGSICASRYTDRPDDGGAYKRQENDRISAIDNLQVGDTVILAGDVLPMFVVGIVAPPTLAWDMTVIDRLLLRDSIMGQYHYADRRSGTTELFAHVIVATDLWKRASELDENQKRKKREREDIEPCRVLYAPDENGHQSAHTGKSTW